MFIRPYTFLDYPTVKEWADKRQFPLVPPEFLPQTGFIIPEVCVGFLYKTDSPIAWLEWIISNPEATNSNEALDFLIETACTEAKRQGFKMVFTSVSHKGLMERYKAHGFIVGDESVSQLVRNL